MPRITTIFQRGMKSTSLETTVLVWDPETGQYWAKWVLKEEQDRRRARRTILPAFAEFKRLIASPRSS